jgi:hypothetical protein
VINDNYNLSICSELSDNNKELILKYLEEISASDGEMSAEEKLLLSKIESASSSFDENTDLSALKNEALKSLASSGTENFIENSRDVEISKPTMKICQRCDSENEINAEECTECGAMI